MTSAVRVGPAFVAAVVLLVVGASDVKAAQRSVAWLVASDVHFTPFAGASKPLVGRLQQAPVRQWPKLLARTGRAPSPYGEDTNAALLESSLRAMRQAAPSPPVVLIAGDLLAHEFKQTYEKLAPRPTGRGYREFVDKTVAHLAARFGARFPRAQFVLTLGNNDSYCGDYQATPGSRFLARTARAWRPLVNRHRRAAGFVKSFGRLGSYVARLPRPRLHVVSVDDVFWSAEYRNACGSPRSDPGARQARWLGAVMRKLPPGHRALVITHEPPGIDVFATLDGSGAPVPLLTDTGQEALLGALDGGRVPALVFGHLHMSTYRVGRETPMLGVPSISPEFGNNPAFLTATVGRRGEIADYTAHALDLRRPRSRWRREYIFRDFYGLPAFDAASLTRLHALLAGDARLRRAYRHFYVSRGRYPITESQYPAYACGSIALDVKVFEACVNPDAAGG
jgi:sphingomyelin phosphodiesterase acid-like 3